MLTIDVDGKAFAPSKILCVGRNFAAHARELGNEIPEQLVVFNKPNSSITDILRSNAGGEVLHYETELAFAVVGGELAAVGVGLDLTKRALQSKLKEHGLPWERAKAFDGAVLFSRFVGIPGDLAGLSLRLDIDGKQRQTGGVEQMLCQPRAILDELKSYTTPEDGDVIMTGTPEGVGEVHTGQRFEARVLYRGTALVTVNWVAQ